MTATTQHLPYDSRYPRLVKSLCERASKAEIVPFIPVCFSDWAPVAYQCHANANVFCQRMLISSPVHGFLIDEIGDGGIVAFIPHTVVRSSAGDLVDVTPLPDMPVLPFIEHIGDMTDFKCAAFDRAIFADLNTKMQVHPLQAKICAGATWSYPCTEYSYSSRNIAPPAGLNRHARRATRAIRA